MGNGFAYMGREYRMVVGETELFCDMLFYNTKIHSYIICEIKTQPFEPSFLGQLSGYVSCANHVLKGEGDNPTIGLLICKNKDEVMARYALEGYKDNIQNKTTNCVWLFHFQRAAYRCSKNARKSKRLQLSDFAYEIIFVTKLKLKVFQSLTLT